MQGATERKGMKKAVKYVIAALIGAAICCAVLFGKNIVSAETAQARFKLLSDAFAGAGLILLLAGLFVWTVRQGAFSGLGYAFRSIFVSLHAKEYRDEHKESFSEYRARKSERKTPCLFLIVTGCAYLVPAIVFTVAYFYV